MKVHHFDAGTMCPKSARLVNGRGGWFERGRLVCHVLLVESRDGLVLVDTGLGLADIARPQQLGESWLKTASPRLSTEQAAINRVRALGFDPGDVRHVIVTHLDRDHASGMTDFPRARLHVHRLEHESALQDRRYRRAHLDHLKSADLRVYDDGGESWFGFQGVRALDDREPELLLVPLRGHTRGLCGVAVKSDGRWLLHAGDAYFFHGQVEERAWVPLGLRMFQRMADADRAQRVANQARLRKLALEHRGDVEVFCSHDPEELDRHARG